MSRIIHLYSIPRLRPSALSPQIKIHATSNKDEKERARHPTGATERASKRASERPSEPGLERLPRPLIEEETAWPRAFCDSPERTHGEGRHRRFKDAARREKRGLRDHNGGVCVGRLEGATPSANDTAMTTTTTTQPLRWTDCEHIGEQQPLCGAASGAQRQTDTAGRRELDCSRGGGLGACAAASPALGGGGGGPHRARPSSRRRRRRRRRARRAAHYYYSWWRIAAAHRAAARRGGRAALAVRHARHARVGRAAQAALRRDPAQRIAALRRRAGRAALEGGCFGRRADDDDDVGLSRRRVDRSGGRRRAAVAAASVFELLGRRAAAGRRNRLRPLRHRRRRRPRDGPAYL
mmetsp:Transcript_3796/g.14992  ORF Transcript_3796/g.14992 Transcript_3796/m.14992 type:complete len:352 (+) Transcript_3796:987-2042(+)